MVAIFAVGAVCGYSQAVNATLLGTITDSSGGVVQNVKVTITEINTGVSRSGQTNESGNYTFPDLAPGQYAVAAELQGFKKENRKDITLTINTSTRVDIQLVPGNMMETVEVTGLAPELAGPHRAASHQREHAIAAACA